MSKELDSLGKRHGNAGDCAADDQAMEFHFSSEVSRERKCVMIFFIPERQPQLAQEGNLVERSRRSLPSIGMPRRF